MTTSEKRKKGQTHLGWVRVDYPEVIGTFWTHHTNFLHISPLDFVWRDLEDCVNDIQKL